MEHKHSFISLNQKQRGDVVVVDWKATAQRLKNQIQDAAGNGGWNSAEIKTELARVDNEVIPYYKYITRLHARDNSIVPLTLGAWLERRRKPRKKRKDSRAEVERLRKWSALGGLFIP